MFNVGDEVIIHLSTEEKKLGTIEKITPSGFLQVNGCKGLFYSNGKKRTTNLRSHQYIIKATPELIDDIHVNEIVRYINTIRRWDKIHKDKLKQIYAILTEA
jgi:hypothetical protein